MSHRPSCRPPGRGRRVAALDGPAGPAEPLEKAETIAISGLRALPPRPKRSAFPDDTSSTSKDRSWVGRRGREGPLLLEKGRKGHHICRAGAAAIAGASASQTAQGCAARLRPAAMARPRKQFRCLTIEEGKRNVDGGVLAGREQSRPNETSTILRFELTWDSGSTVLVCRLCQ